LTLEDAFYGLLLRELEGWHTRSVVRIGTHRWEAVIGRPRGRGIEAGAGANPALALRTAWARVEARVGAGELEP
jgi:hypothetical protein